MLAGAAVAVVVVVVVLCVIVVAASGSVVVTSFVFGISSNIFGEAPSHFTRKWRRRVRAEHESGSPVGRNRFIRGKPTGHTTHRSVFFNSTGFCRSG